MSGWPWRRPRPEHGPVTLTRRRIYLLPTRHGLILAMVLLAMLIAAINYQSGLVYLLTFLLTSLAIVSILHSYRNLHGLVVHFGQPVAVFAGDRADYPLLLENPHNRPRYAIGIRRNDSDTIISDLPATDTHWLRLSLPTTRRGLMPVGRLTISSIYPLGLFRAWSYLYPARPVLVYPRPDGPQELPAPQPHEGDSDGTNGQGSEDFDSLRPYHDGDSLKHIHWKALARGQGLVTKQFAGGSSAALWLHWEQTGRPDMEQRLSTLTRWVLEADSRGLSYGLILPGQEIPPASDEAQRKRCLEALALYGIKV